MSCEHEEKLLAKRAINGSDCFGYQCQRCGKWEAVKKTSLTWDQRREAVEFDPDRSKAFWSERMESLNQQRQEKNQKWWDEYTAYLLTPKWHDKRTRVLARDNHLCQACLKRKATQAHHLTYKHVFNEPLFDLVAVCEVCHQAVHQSERLNEHSNA